MQDLSRQFEADNPDIELNWVVLEENILRQRTTTDVASQGGQFDVLTIGSYETPIWARRGWLRSLNGLPAEYDVTTCLSRFAPGFPTKTPSMRCLFTVKARCSTTAPICLIKQELRCPKAPPMSKSASGPSKFTIRATASTAFVCGANRAGGKHGLSHHSGQYLWRPLV
jgi:hypothetical protein